MHPGVRWLSTLLLCACTSAARPAPEPARNPMAPVTVRIEVASGQPVAGERMTFRARIERNGAWTAPIAVAFKVPPGANLVSGQAAGTLAEGSAAPEIELELYAVPSEDLVLVASSQTAAAGFHAEARYRFGRPDPIESGPAKDGPRLTGPNGADLGSPVDMPAPK